MATVVHEIERKYDCAAGGSAALEAVRAMPPPAGVAAVAEPAEQVLDAVYYDTPDLRLIRAGITLRRRTGGDDAGWHLKLPAGAGARDEIQLPLDGRHRPAEGRPVPEELAALVRAYARDAALVPLVRLTTRRRLLRLLGDASQTLAEVCVDQVSARPAAGAAIAWDEIEAELLDGDPGLLTAIDERLRQAGAWPAATATKLQRALAGRLPAAAPPRPPLTASSASGDVLLAYLRQQVAAISRCDPRVRRGDPGAVHQLRVAAQRARSALEAFGGIIVEREAARPLCGELSWLAGALAQASEAEVLLARLAAALGGVPRAQVTGPVEDRISARLAAELTRAGKAALRALDESRYLRLLDALDELLADPPLLPLAEREAGKTLARPVRHAARRLERALADVPVAEDRDAAVHEARKAARRARYAAEAALPALGSRVRHQAIRAEELQQLLDDHHDSVVAREVLLSLAAEARAAGEDTFTYGLMYQRQACQAAAIEKLLCRLATWAAITG